MTSNDWSLCKLWICLNVVPLNYVQLCTTYCLLVTWIHCLAHGMFWFSKVRRWGVNSTSHGPWHDQEDIGLAKWDELVKKLTKRQGCYRSFFASFSLSSLLLTVIEWYFGDPCMVLYLSTFGWLLWYFFIVNLGKYTSHMHSMGYFGVCGGAVAGGLRPVTVSFERPDEDVTVAEQGLGFGKILPLDGTWRRNLIAVYIFI